MVIYSLLFLTLLFVPCPDWPSLKKYSRLKYCPKDGSVHDLERVVKGLFIDSCYFNNINLKAFDK